MNSIIAVEIICAALGILALALGNPIGIAWLMVCVGLVVATAGEV